MGALALTLACVLAAASAAIACWEVPSLRGRARRGVGRVPLRLGASLIGLCEQLGHWAPFVRVSRRAARDPFVGRLVGALAGGGVRLSRLGACAALVVASVTCALACCFVARSVLGAPVGVAGLAVACAAIVGRDERREQAAALAQMPEVLRTLSNALSAGRSLPQAISFVGRNMAEPLGGQFLRASFEIEGGRPTDEAVRALTERVRAPGMELLGTALSISQRTGSSLSELFARTARMVASTCSLRRDLAVKTSQARLSAKVVAGLPLLLVGVLTLVSPDYRAGLASPGGGACLCVSAMLDLVALAIVRGLMRRSLR